MKLLIIHNFYTHLTGEDLAVEEISQILKNSGKVNPVRYSLSNGVKVIEYYKYSKDFQSLSWFKKIITLIKANLPFYVPEEFKEILNKEKPDIAQIHNLIPLINIWILKELKKRNIPIIFFIHNYRIFCPRGTCFLKDKFCIRCFNNSLIFCILNNCLDNLLYSLLYAYRIFIQRLFLRYIDLFISSSNFTRDFYKRYFPEINIAILKEYIDISGEIKNLKQEKKDFIIFAGRLVKEKGIPTLLQAASLLKDIQFKICGEGPLMEHYQGFVKEKNLKNVEFLGLQKRKVSLIQIKDARIVLFPSLWYEVYPRVIREAMYLSTPVIASRVGANTEIIQHNKTGFLFDPEDVPSLVELVKRLWDDENLRKKITIEAYRMIKKLSDSEEYIKNFLEIYKNLC